MTSTIFHKSLTGSFSYCFNEKSDEKIWKKLGLLADLDRDLAAGGPFHPQQYYFCRAFWHGTDAGRTVKRRGFLAEPVSLFPSHLPGIFKCFLPWDPSWKPWLGLSPGERIFKTAYADDPICTGGFLCHSGTDLDRVRKSVCFYLFSGGSSHDLWRYAGRA